MSAPKRSSLSPQPVRGRGTDVFYATGGGDSYAAANLTPCYRRNSLRTTVVFSARIFADRVDSAASLKTA